MGASVWAFRATDMKVELARGFLTSFSLDRIVVSDGLDTDLFHGIFAVTQPSFGGVLFPFPTVPQPGDLPEVLFARVSGTLSGYEVLTSDGQPRYTVDLPGVAANSAFQALAFRDTDAFQTFVFAGDDNFVGSSLDDRLIGYAGSDALSGMNGDDDLSGGRGDDRLYGGNGDDVLKGGFDRDSIFGGDGDDVLNGSRSIDTLRGEDGDDRLLGGTSRDYLNGGDDDDTFQFRSIADSRPGSSTRDQVQDFRPGDDIVDLHLIDADATASGSQAFVFIGAAAFDDTPGQLRYDPSTHLLQGDTTGDGKADFEVNFTNKALIGIDDLIL
jgi:Ca2+-binding RTX toxin-like protein